MTPGLYLIIAIAGLLIMFVLIVAAVSVALSKQNKYLKIQTSILAQIAKKKGVDEEDMRRMSRTEKLPNII